MGKSSKAYHAAQAALLALSKACRLIMHAQNAQLVPAGASAVSISHCNASSKARAAQQGDTILECFTSQPDSKSFLEVSEGETASFEDDHLERHSPEEQR